MARFTTLLRMQIVLLCASIFSTVSASADSADALAAANGLTVRQLYQFPKYAFMENLRQRTNGMLLTTRLDVPLLLQFDPYSNTEPAVVHNFSDYNAVGGITETHPDLFFVEVADFNIFKLDTAPGSYAVYKVDYRGVGKTGTPNITQFAKVPEAAFLDGMTYVPTSETLWMADASLGLIFSMDIHTGEYQVVVNNTLTQKCHANDFEAANGIKYFNNAIYWTNSGCGYYAKQNLDRVGNPFGPSTIVSNPALNMDDFCITHDGTAYLGASFINQIVQIAPNGSATIIAGNLNSSQIAEPTAMIMGRMKQDRKKGTMYVVTGGALGDPINGTEIVGAQLIAIDGIFGA